MSRDGRIDLTRPIEFRRITRSETHAMLDKSRVIATYVEIGDAVGLMVNSDQPLTRDEKACLIRAARALPVRD